MDTVDLKLAQDCEALAVSASEGVTWLKGAAEESPTVAQQAPSLISELQKVRNQSRKLARAARRRMCVGVFGQLIWISFAQRMVVVKLSTWPDFTDTAKERATLAALRRIAEALA